MRLGAAHTIEQRGPRHTGTPTWIIKGQDVRLARARRHAFILTGAATAAALALVPLRITAGMIPGPDPAMWAEVVDLLAVTPTLGVAAANRWSASRLRKHKENEYDEKDWRRASTPWDLTISSTGPHAPLLYARALAFGFHPTYEGLDSTTWFDLHVGSTPTDVARALDAADAVPADHLGGDVEHLRGLLNKVPRQVRRALPSADILAGEKDLTDMIGVNVEVGDLELLDMGRFTWALPKAVAVRQAQAILDRDAAKAEAARKAEREAQEAAARKAIEEAERKVLAAPGRELW